MKVSEAKEKVCPFMPFVSQKSDADGIEVRHFNSTCICSGCMAWVYSYGYHDESFSEDEKDGYCARIGNE